MRKLIILKSALLLVLTLLIPFLWNQDIAVAVAAATPSLTQTKLEIKGIGEVYDININDKVAKSKYLWTSSDKTVATVTKAGLVTSIGAGNATIRCLITYPSKKTKSLTCKVTVTVPATAISISEVPRVNNAYQLALNSTVDLNAELTPSESTDKAFWYIDKDNMTSDPSCISLDGSNQGIVTGVKAGKAVVRVRAAQTTSQEAAAASDIDDAIIIEVVAPTATYKSADITSPNQITVEFDSPIQKSTMINTDGSLSSNITITRCKNTKNVLAADPGNLIASLSSDNKTLTITSSNTLDGIYGIEFSSKILTISGVALDEDYKQMVFADTTAPFVLTPTYDDTGLIATIPFSEAVDFSNFTVKASVIGTASASSTSLIILGNTNNYIISADKKSVTINMSNIASTDYGKVFSITFTGIKDYSGNTPTGPLITYLMMDTTPKPQAQLLSLVRTGYTTLTATFDKIINTQKPGYVQISGGLTITGVVDSTNARKVNYTIPNMGAYTGVQSVSIGYWSSYNVMSSDTSADHMTTISINFTVETTSPVVVASEFDIATSILKLTYSEAVSVPLTSGYFLARLTTTTNEIIEAQNISYTVLSHSLGDQIVELKLTFSNTSRTGYYTFTAAQGFAVDSYNNFSQSKELTINNSTGPTELPGPYLISQSTTNLCEISVMFAYMLDVTSATTVSNYKIPGVTVLSASIKSNTSETGATVVLNIQSVSATADYSITITGVSGYNNSYTAIANYSASVLLKENVAPICGAVPIFDTVSKNVIRLNFNEAIQGTLVVTVTQISGTNSEILANTVTVSGNSAYINLTRIPVNGSYLRITVVSNNITDAAGNLATFATPTMGVAATY